MRAFLIMKIKLHGVNAPHKKNTAGMAALRMPPPETVKIPLQMNIGAPAAPVVAFGDHVDVGQVIAKSDTYVSADIHASISGTVKRPSEYLMPNGKTAAAIVIESDGKMTVSPSVKPPVIIDRKSFIDAVRASGCVGLGGAGFPTSVKLDVDPSRIEEVIVNGAECEPYITSDTRTMVEKPDLIVRGCRTLHKYLGVGKIYIAIEKNKPEAIAAIKAASSGDDYIKIKVLPSLYPQGGEKVLIYNVTGKTVPEGKLPIDVGSIVINCTTLSIVENYVETGMPLTEKLITVDGGSVREPKNVIVPIGTMISDVFDFCGGFKSEPAKILSGGLMMGMCLYSLDAPVTKTMNALLALDKKEAKPLRTTSCIRCGNCISHCPFGLNPLEIGEALSAKNGEALAALKVNLCMECGCCSFICPAGRPLTTQNKLAKAELTAYLAKKKQKEEKAKEAHI